MVLASAILIAAPLFWLTRRAAPDDRARLRKLWPVVAIAIAVPLIALGILAAVGKYRPTLGSEGAPMSDDVAALHARTATQGGQAAGDLGEAIDRLRARLAANPSDANGWRSPINTWAAPPKPRKPTAWPRPPRIPPARIRIPMPAPATASCRMHLPR